MAKNAAAALQLDTDLLITHCVPHPSLVKFRVPEKTATIQKLESTLGIPFDCNPNEDAEKAARKGFATPTHFVDFWNYKSFTMGSDILSGYDAQPKDGLCVISGHNHRSEDGRIRTVNGKTVSFYSHQPSLVS
jgi:hypothetical protein